MDNQRLYTIIKRCIIGGAGLFIFFLYATIKTKSTSLHQVAPFKQYINQTVITNQDIFLMTEKDVPDGKFPYIVLDSAYAGFQWYVDRSKLSPPEVTLLDTIPAGSSITFTKAVNYTNGVSGLSKACLFGKITLQDKEYLIYYPWGKRSERMWLEGKYDQWEFRLAPWQTEKDTNYYTVPDAQYW